MGFTINIFTITKLLFRSKLGTDVCPSFFIVVVLQEFFVKVRFAVPTSMKMILLSFCVFSKKIRGSFNCANSKKTRIKKENN